MTSSIRIASRIKQLTSLDQRIFYTNRNIQEADSALFERYFKRPAEFAIRGIVANLKDVTIETDEEMLLPLLDILKIGTEKNDSLLINLQEIRCRENLYLPTSFAIRYHEKFMNLVSPSNQSLILPTILVYDLKLIESGEGPFQYELMEKHKARCIRTAFLFDS